MSRTKARLKRKIKATISCLCLDLSGFYLTFFCFVVSSLTSSFAFPSKDTTAMHSEDEESNLRDNYDIVCIIYVIMLG